MNHNERVAIGETWLGLASAYGKEINSQALTLMLDSVSDLSPNEVMHQLREWMKRPNNKSYPLPGDIRAIVNPQADPDSLAQEAAARTIQAIGRFGWTEPQKAREFIGELGWRAVQRFGGWQYLCENVGVEINQSTIFAQIRDLSRATVKLGDAGILDQPIPLPSARSNDRNALPSSARDILKILTSPKGGGDEQPKT